MVYCTKCGTAVEGRFCPNCGAPVTLQAGAPFEGAAPFETPAGAESANRESGTAPFPGRAQSVNMLPTKIASLICYLVPVIGPLVFLLLEPYSRNPLIRFNAWQGLFVQLAYMAIRVIIGIFWDVSWRLGDLLSEIASVAYLAIIVLMIVKSLQDEKYVLPVVGPLAEKQK